MSLQFFNNVTELHYGKIETSAAVTWMHLGWKVGETKVELAVFFDSHGEAMDAQNALFAAGVVLGDDWFGDIRLSEHNVNQITVTREGSTQIALRQNKYHGITYSLRAPND